MKTLLRTLATLTVALLTIGVPTIQAAVKPPTPPRIIPPTPPRIVVPTPPKIAAPNIGQPAPTPTDRVTLDVTNGNLVLRAASLTPGVVYDATYAVYGCGDPFPYLLAVSTGAAVRSDGTFTIAFISVDELYYYALPEPLCEVVAWLRPDNSASATVGTYPDGQPIRAEHDFY